MKKKWNTEDIKIRLYFYLIKNKEKGWRKKDYYENFFYEYSFILRELGITKARYKTMFKTIYDKYIKEEPLY